MVLRIGIIIFTWILFLSTVQGIDNAYFVSDQMYTQVAWHARISVDNGKNCGGAVISERYVITSYHCLIGGKNFNVTLGCPWEDHPECENHTGVFFHARPDAYTANPLDVLDYIALLELENKIIYSDYIQPVQLPRRTTDSNRPRRIISSYANATGSWPATKWLQWLPMIVLPDSECSKHIPFSTNYVRIENNTSLEYLMCAQGDLDGNKRGNLYTETNEPLVQNNVLIGILKGTILNSFNNGISLFIDVFHFADWINNRISMEGFSATQNEFPYHAYIGVNNINGVHRNNCSGAVITQEIVISAKHCVDGGTSYRIKLGYLNPAIANNETSAYDHITRHLAISTEFDGVSLIKLEIPIRFNSSIQPIRLPRINEDIFTRGRSYAIATGFYELGPIGDYIDHTDLPRPLQWMPMTLAEVTDECKKKYDNEFITNSLCGRRLSERYDVNSCTDPGGPLVLNDRKTLVGIFIGSHRTRNACKDSGILSQFIDIRPLVEWIYRTMNETDWPLSTVDDAYYVTQKQFPWHARISVDNGKNCSGAVISERYVITSYYCISVGRNFNVTLGCPHEGHPACKYHSCAFFHAPPDAYTANSSDFLDYIALLELDNKIIYSDYIQPVQLPKPKTDFNRPITNIFPYANVTGYSHTDKWYFQWLPMIVLPGSECFKQIPISLSYIHITYYLTLKFLLCAQGEDKDGNKRGNLYIETSEPLVQNNTLIGILIGTVTSSSNNGISLFIDVLNFTDWINTRIRMEGFSATNNATQNEFPYHAYIGVNNINRVLRNNCSGAVITPKFVISAEHCVHGGISFRIKLGYLNPAIANNEPSAYDHLTLHSPIFPENTRVNEGVALIKLEIPIRFNSSIHRIELPRANEHIFTRGVGYAIATGFYEVEPSPNLLLEHISDYIVDHAKPRYLQWTPMRFAEVTDECKNWYDKDFISNSLCGRRLLKRYDVNSCTDPGGPLVLNDRKTLVGIFIGSYNDMNSCKDGGILSQFIDVRLHVDWIKRTVNTTDFALS